MIRNGVLKEIMFSKDSRSFPSLNETLSKTLTNNFTGLKVLMKDFNFKKNELFTFTKFRLINIWFKKQKAKLKHWLGHVDLI